MRKKVRTICTLGPSTNTFEKIVELINAGMDVARLNFSHGDHAGHRKIFDLIHQASKDTCRPVAIMADLQGPKIRLSKFEGVQSVEVFEGEEITILSKNVLSTGKVFGCTYEQLAGDVKPGDRVLIDDGNIRLQVKTIHKDEITLTVMVDGIMKPSKGINLPGVDVSSPALTEKDREDLKFALTLPVDYVALSFVRKPEDVLEARRIIHQEGLHIPVISKIEREEAVHCIEDILHVSEGVMVARGDMGVELSPERVPAIQKRIIRLANQMDKTVIVATQMLESMIDKPIPTRAEASDVANAILDGADCTMLSGETAAGKYPFEAVKMMERIGFEAENFFISDRLVRRDDDKYQNSAFYSSDAVCKAAVTTARQVGAKAIVTFTSSGKTALLVSKQKPDMPILAVTFTEEVARRMNMYWGVETVIINKAESTDEMIHMAAGAALETGTAQPGDFIVITAGIPAGRPGATNLIKLHRIACHPKNVNDQEVFEMPEGKLLLKRGRCIGCGYCPAICPFGVYSMIDERVYVNKEKLHLCTRDGRCADGCPTHVIEFK